MNLSLTIPIAARLGSLFMLGTIVAGFVNLAVYRLAWNQRPTSPWSAAPAGLPPRRWADRLPLVGWWRMRREVAWHGRGFWLRPLGVELVSGAVFAALYYLEIELSTPRWLMGAGVQPPIDLLSTNVPLVLHLGYLSHVLLFSLMLSASLIDFDEQMIPDAVTISGTLLGLALAAIYPWSLLPAGDWLLSGQRAVEFVTLASPNPWAPPLVGMPSVEALAVALGCWTLWCVGLLPRHWKIRRGLRTAWRVFWHRLRVERVTYAILPMWLAGFVAIGLVAAWTPAASWVALLTALVGMAVGGGIIWLVRVVAGWALTREAMGFGDVTLMAMIGAFVGWQGAIVVFFLAPFAGAVLGIAQWLSRGEHEVPYGPFLCLATCVVVGDWSGVWPTVSDYFALGELFAVLLVVSMALLGLMLVVYRALRQRIGSAQSR